MIFLCVSKAPKKKSIKTLEPDLKEAVRPGDEEHGPLSQI
jgi:hypothetical protein